MTDVDKAEAIADEDLDAAQGGFNLGGVKRRSDAKGYANLETAHLRQPGKDDEKVIQAETSGADI